MNDAVELKSWISLSAGVALILLAAGGFLLLKNTAASDSIVLSALAGLLLLSMSLAGLIIAGRALGVSTPQEALGLPSGSVRALLAFSLVIAFLAVASWSLGDHGSHPGALVSVTPPFPSGDVATELEKLQSVYPPPRFLSVTSNAPRPGELVAKVFDQGAEQQLADLQKQIVTILATALVTVLGFYFGGKSASDGAAATAAAVGRIQESMSSSPPSTSSTPATLEAIKSLVQQVSSLADAATAQLSDLGEDPLQLLKDALANSQDTGLRAQLDAASKAQSDLTQAVQAASTDKQRAQSALDGLTANETDPAKLEPAQDRLNQLLTDALSAKKAADEAHARFWDAHDRITRATAAG